VSESEIDSSAGQPDPDTLLGRLVKMGFGVEEMTARIEAGGVLVGKGDEQRVIKDPGYSAPWPIPVVFGGAS
jgi:hypothetical protein